MARKRGGLAGLYDRNKGAFQVAAPLLAGAIGYGLGRRKEPAPPSLEDQLAGLFTAGEGPEVLPPVYGGPSTPPAPITSVDPSLVNQTGRFMSEPMASEPIGASTMRSPRSDRRMTPNTSAPDMARRARLADMFMAGMTPEDQEIARIRQLPMVESRADQFPRKVGVLSMSPGDVRIGQRGDFYRSMPAVGTSAPTPRRPTYEIMPPGPFPQSQMFPPALRRR